MTSKRSPWRDVWRGAHGSRQLQLAVVVAVRVVRMVQVAVDEIVDVVPVRHRLMSAAGAVLVVGGVPAALMIGSAPGGVRVADFDGVLIDVIRVRAVQMAVAQVINVTGMHDGGMPAVGAVGVVVALVYLVRFHRSSGSLASVTADGTAETGERQSRSLRVGFPSADAASG
jgi:hypothetical protein